MGKLYGEGGAAAVLELYGKAAVSGSGNRRAGGNDASGQRGIRGNCHGVWLWPGTSDLHIYTGKRMDGDIPFSEVCDAPVDFLRSWLGDSGRRLRQRAGEGEAEDVAFAGNGCSGRYVS